jgi:hypothetical protein
MKNFLRSLAPIFSIPEKNELHATDRYAQAKKATTKKPIEEKPMADTVKKEIEKESVIFT